MLYVKAAQARADAEFSLAEARRSARAGSTVARDAVARAARAEEASVTLRDEARDDVQKLGHATFSMARATTEESRLDGDDEVHYYTFVCVAHDDRRILPHSADQRISTHRKCRG